MTVGFKLHSLSFWLINTLQITTFNNIIFVNYLLKFHTSTSKYQKPKLSLKSSKNLKYLTKQEQVKCIKYI